MKYTMLFLLLVILVAGCSQIESPLDSEDVKSAPGADVNGEEQPIVDCSEPAYLISVSPAAGTIIDKDTLITLTFNCAPYDLVMFSPRGRYFDTRYQRDTLGIADYKVEYKYEYNRNVATIDFKILPVDEELEDFISLVGRKSATFKVDFKLKWQSGIKTLSYDIHFPEIEGTESYTNAHFEDILNNPQDYLGDKVSFEAFVERSEKYGNVILITDNPNISFFIDNQRSELNLTKNKKYRFEVVISGIHIGKTGKITIEANFIFDYFYKLQSPPVLVE